MIDRYGTWPATVSAEGRRLDDVRCRIVTLTSLGTLHGEGALRSLPTTGSPAVIRLDSWPYTTAVPSDGTAYISCLVQPGGKIFKVTSW